MAPSSNKIVLSIIFKSLSIHNPFEKITLNDKLDNPYQYSVAVGCALRGLEK